MTVDFSLFWSVPDVCFISSWLHKSTKQNNLNFNFQNLFRPIYKYEFCLIRMKPWLNIYN